MKDKRLTYLLASCLVYMGLLVGVPYIRSPRSLAMVLAAKLAVVVVLMLAQISICRWFTSITLKWTWAAAVLLVSIACWAGTVAKVTAPYAHYEVEGVGSLPVVMLQHPRPAVTRIPMMKPIMDSNGKVVRVEKVFVTGVLKPSDVNFRLFVYDRVADRSRVLTNLLTILAATAFGYLVSFILRSPNIVLPVGGLAAYVDIWTVLIGPTSKAIEKAPHVVSAVSVSMPSIATHRASFQPVSYIGPADFIFIALFFGAVYRLKMSPSRTFWMIFPAVTLGMISVFMFGFPSMGLPALVLIGPAVIVANYKHFKLDRQEWIAMCVTAVLLVAATVVAMPYLLHR